MHTDVLARFLPLGGGGELNRKRVLEGNTVRTLSHGVPFFPPAEAPLLVAPARRPQMTYVHHHENKSRQALRPDCRFLSIRLKHQITSAASDQPWHKQRSNRCPNWPQKILSRVAL
ncbi:hypothetical protein V2G26_000309 [Clonostachys chloroleuca]